VLRGLESTDSAVLGDVIEALLRIPTKPRKGDAAPYRLLLLACDRLEAKQRGKAVELLRIWGGRSFGAAPGDEKSELADWSRWFAQTFPAEPPLPQPAADRPTESRYTQAELLAYLDRDPRGRKGDPARGRLVFARAQCARCHRHGTEGEGVGPDLSTVGRRYRRADILASLLTPSKVISDQYRTTVIETADGVIYTGLVSTQGDTVSVLRGDGTKVTLKKEQIKQQFASLVSVMPERLLDPLTKPEIADLFAFLESSPE
jgi:putative heme-binding domain-containing protein